jgi:hypothetical protein
VGDYTLTVVVGLIGLCRALAQRRLP